MRLLHAWWPPRPVELVAAAVLAALGVGEVLVPFTSRQGSGSTASALVGILLVAVAMSWCRRAPLVSLLWFMAVWAVIGSLWPTYALFDGQFLPLEVMVFMAARFGSRRTALIGAGLAAATLVSIDLTVEVLQEPGEYAFHWAVTAMVWSAGFGLRTLERRAHDSTRRAVEAELGAAERAFGAVLEERTRIARELHDIVGHAVTSMVVQAGAAEQAVDDREFVARALGAIRTTGNEAMAEMRRLVTMLRETDDVPFAPAPSLESLPALVTNAVGPRVRLSIAGEPRPLPTGVDLAAFRIVQEALTNVRRHSGATRCEVTVTYAPDHVRVDVVDDGCSSVVPSPGNGITGMHERAMLYGGEVRAGPRPDGGFAVSASLPVTT